MKELPRWANSMVKLLELANTLGAACEEYDKLARQVEQLRATNADLLTACEALLSLIDTLNMGGDLFIDNWPAVKAGRAAIDKAKREG